MAEFGRLFRKILVANRGEIALRVMRACRELGIPTVAVYGEGERDAPHVRYADEAFRIPSEQALPYLDVAAIVTAARTAGADGVHPGYGFLAENAAFARACAEAGMVFIGPPPDAIAAMGDKVAARRVARAAGVPVVPGSPGPVDAAGARAFGDEQGYPIAVKASAGGGGRGFRVAWSAGEVREAWQGASGEASRYFGDPAVYVERYLDHPRHVEIQVFADNHGHAVSLGERDCSIQRRHQKLIEESPSPAIDPPTRARMGETAVALARAVDYRNAGTVEFLFQDGDFYFLEMNTRIQVEHPVTELVTGIDLAREQIRVAAGLPLSFGEGVPLVGHAIECRINAEDPARGFAPTPGRITAYRAPAGFGVRVDSAAEVGYVILPSYDSLIAKLVVWGRDRDEALARLDRALSDYVIEGVASTIPFDRAVLAVPEFRRGDFDTRFIDRHPEVVERLGPSGVTSAPEQDGVELPEEYVVEVGGKRFDVRLYARSVAAPAPAPRRGAPRPHARASAPIASGREDVTSPIQGTVLSVGVEVGQSVTAGTVVCVVEAMKMENEITAPHDGVVRAVDVTPGQTVQIGTRVALIEAAP
ncbi:MAG TPA: acetyl-CoA carboxylase biotin carboxylase subunit [Thermomicrobiaceae bacterium]|nr:acetyl-CoA carboxylase biotin carboxylase subunit [Thermomicrobiaceae bacterium]